MCVKIEIERAESKLWEYILRNGELPTYREATMITKFNRQRLRDNLPHLISTKTDEAEDLLDRLKALAKQLQQDIDEAYRLRDYSEVGEKRIDALRFRQSRLRKVIEDLEKEEDAKKKKREAEEERQELLRMRAGGNVPELPP